MILIDNVIVSFDILKCHFACDLKSCKGCCCIEGDAGAPLEDDEINIISDSYSKIEPYMTELGRQAVQEQGVYSVDSEGDKGTTLVNNRECAFAILQNGMTLCAIEKAFEAGDIDFQKPISCHLYPIRVSKLGENDGLSYHRWDICKSSMLSKTQGLPLYKYLKAPLIRKYGESWYKELELTVKEIEQSGGLEQFESISF